MDVLGVDAPKAAVVLDPKAVVGAGVVIEPKPDWGVDVEPKAAGLLV